MNRLSVSRWMKVVFGLIIFLGLSLTSYGEASAHRRHYPGVVHYRAPYVVYAPPRPVVIHYAPAYHADCLWRSGYYHHASFGPHHHHYHPGGIYFGVHVGF